MGIWTCSSHLLGSSLQTFSWWLLLVIQSQVMYHLEQALPHHPVTLGSCAITLPKNLPPTICLSTSNSPDFLSLQQHSYLNPETQPCPLPQPQAQATSKPHGSCTSHQPSKRPNLLPGTSQSLLTDPRAPTPPLSTPLHSNLFSSCSLNGVFK